MRSTRGLLVVGTVLLVGTGLAEEILKTFLTTPFEGGRHERRVAMLADIENEEASK